MLVETTTTRQEQGMVTRVKSEETHSDKSNHGNRSTCMKACFLLMLGIHKGIRITGTNNTTNKFKVHGSKEN